MISGDRVHWRTRLQNPGFHLAALFALGVILHLNHLWVNGIPGNDDGTYAAGALDMMDSGDWLTPRFNGDPQFSTAPPMWYWVSMASFRLFGPSDFVAKFAGGTATVLAGLAVFLVALRLFQSVELAAFAAMAFNLDPFVLKYGHHALGNTAWAGTAALALGVLYEARARSSLHWYLAFSILSAASILFKSALGCFPLMIGGVWMIWDRADRKQLLSFAGAAVLALALGGLWYWVEILRFGNNFVREHFGGMLFHYAFNYRAVDQAASPLRHFYVILRRMAVSSVLLSPLGLWSLAKQRSSASRLVIAWILVPVACLAVTARFETRYMAPVLGGIAIGLGHFLNRVWSLKAKQNALAAIYAGGLVWALGTLAFPLNKARDFLTETRPLIDTIRAQVPPGRRWLLVVSPEAPIDPQWPNRMLVEHYELQGPINRGVIQQILFYTRRKFRAVHAPDIAGWKGDEKLVFSDNRFLPPGSRSGLRPVLNGPDWTLYRRR